MSGDVVIRPDEVVLRPVRADARDAANVARLSDELGYSSTAEQVLARLARMTESPDHHVLVADVAGDVVGLAALSRAWVIHRDELSVRLQTLVVASSMRGRGIGARLVAASEAWALAQGAPTLHLTSGSHRPDAHRFYERLGYVGDGVRFRRHL